MRRTAGIWLSFVLLVAHTSPVRADALRLSLGIPLPLAVYGYLARSDGNDGGQLDFIGSVALDLSYTINRQYRVDLQAWLDGNLIAGSDAHVSAFLYLVSPGLGLAWRPVETAGCALEIGLGFSALASGIVVDDGMRIDTWSFGLRAHAAFDIDVAPGVSVGPVVAFYAHDAPVDAATWYNRPLRGTRHFRAALGARLAL